MDGNLSGLFQGNVGIPWWRNVPVTEPVAKTWPVSLELGIMGIIIALLIALL